ncbi:endoglucanase [Azospirillum fermentarium]|uniref:family 16 glycosylhydrolase n=1 Tax=Azospirillum fermentarium TaxID=1233114 RepID=UPI002227389E|nr:family 16 glycosylhydrolase [Azospirillum fermentarium]MCW2246877.1 endoglucanase [Azospirillum fermentarium]
MRRCRTAAAAIGLLLMAGSTSTLADASTRRIGTGFEDSFLKFDLTRWHKGNGWSNGTYMGCAWNARNLAVQGGNLMLSITGDRAGREQYSCAEYQTNQHYGYGIYQVNLKAVRADGVMTSVSHYTGPPFNDPWDEITMGIAGKDTGKLEVSYVSNGTPHRDTVIDLGFDAAADFHTYGFEWKPDRITWLVDGKPVHTVTGAPGSLPMVPGRLYLQFWNGIGAGEWLKPFKYPGHPLTATVAWVSYREEASTLNN